MLSRFHFGAHRTRRAATVSLGCFAGLLTLAGCTQSPPGGGTPQTSASAAPSASGSAGSSASGKRYKIGFANLTEDIPFAVRVREGIEKAAKDAGNVDLVTADNKLDGAVALANADNFITQGVDGVIEFQTDAEIRQSHHGKVQGEKHSGYRH